MFVASRWPRLGAASLLVSLLTGCPTTSDPPPKAKKEAVPEDEWAGIQRTAEWLYATRDFSGKRLDECVEVLRWVREESRCKGSTCVHARDLAREWQARCPAITDKGEVDHADVEGLLSQYEARSKEDPTPCGAEAEEMLKNGCGKDKTCQSTAESWATRCGKSDATPLLIRMIERSVERKLPEPRRVKLDTRSCEDLQGELRDSVKCGNQFECEGALRGLKSYRDRCESNGSRPTAQVAQYQLAVLAKAGQPTPPIPLLIGAASFSPKEHPTALADSLGLVTAVCETPVKTAEEYLAARRVCKDGKLVFTGIVKEQGDPRARLGTLDLPSDGVLLARLPSMVIAGEAELREKQALAALGPELNRVIELGKRSPGEALPALLQVLQPYRLVLKKSATLRKSLGVRDEGLVPIFQELGKRKQAASKAKMERPMLLGFVQRSRERLLADVKESGEVEAGAPGPFDWLETAELLPLSTEALLGSMKLAVAQARAIRVDKRTSDLARSYAMAQIQVCGEAYRSVTEAKQGLVKCALGIETCDEGRTQQIGKQSDEGRAKIDETRHQLDLLLTGPGSGLREELAEAMASGGCVAPWW
jgi:hypothetical protein